MKPRNSLTVLSALCIISLGLAQQASAKEHVDVVDFAIQGMVTDNCPVLVKTALKKVKGVQGVEASLETKSARVHYVASETSPAEIKKILKDQVGFEAKVVRTVRFQIKGMVTDNCPVLVKTALSKVDGVRKVSASLASKSAEVEYLEGSTSPEALLKVLKDQVGFDAAVAQAKMGG